MRKLTAVLAAGVLTMAMTACSGDDDDAGGGCDQAKAADKLLDSAGEADLELDEACVRDKANQLSDEDAKAIVEAEGDETPALSPEGDALTAELLTCVNTEDMIDQVVSSLPDGIDEDCVREALEDVDLSEFSGGDPPPEFAEAMTTCVTGA